jgi:hypothetical protein
MPFICVFHTYQSRSSAQAVCGMSVLVFCTAGNQDTVAACMIHVEHAAATRPHSGQPAAKLPVTGDKHKAAYLLAAYTTFLVQS